MLALATVVPVAHGNTDKRTRDFDVIGFAIGQPAEQVERRIKEEYPDAQIMKDLETDPSTGNHYVGRIGFSSRAAGTVWLQFLGPEEGNRAVAVRRNVTFGLSGTPAPTSATLMQALSDKYGGTPITLSTENRIYQLWTYGTDGARRDSAAPSCHAVWNRPVPAGGIAVITSDAPRFTQARQGCGVVVTVNTSPGMTTPNGTATPDVVVQQLSVQVVDHSQLYSWQQRNEQRAREAGERRAREQKLEESARPAPRL